MLDSHWSVISCRFGQWRETDVPKAFVYFGVEVGGKEVGHGDWISHQISKHNEISRDFDVERAARRMRG
jgi:hypothetical protein